MTAEDEAEWPWKEVSANMILIYGLAPQSKSQRVANENQFFSNRI